MERGYSTPVYAEDRVVNGPRGAYLHDAFLVRIGEHSLKSMKNCLTTLSPINRLNRMQRKNGTEGTSLQIVCLGKGLSDIKGDI